MSEDEIRALLEELGLVVDEGNLIGGPYIPDGTVRIHPVDEPYTVLGEGSSVEDAYADYELRSSLS